MLRKSCLTLLFLLCSLTIYAQQVPTDYFLHRDQVIPLNRSNSKLGICFRKNTPEMSREEIIQSHIEINKIELTQRDFQIVSVSDTTTLIQLDNLKEELFSDSRITYVSEIFETQNLEIIPNGQIIVSWKEAITETEINELKEAYGLVLERVSRGKNKRHIFSLSPNNHNDIVLLANTIQNLPGVLFAEPDWICLNGGPTATIPNDTYFDDQTNLKQASDKDIDAEESWDMETGSSDVVIAIIDSGVDLDHEDLNIWTNSNEISGNSIDDDGNGYVDDVSGWDFVPTNGDNDPHDEYNHGTPVAGIAGAKTNNSKGTAGVCWGATIMPIRMIDQYGSLVSNSKIADAIDYAVQNGAEILNISWNTTVSNSISNALEEAKTEGRNGKGCIIVCSTGNPACATGNETGVKYPSSLECSIAVGGATSTDYRSGCYDTTLDVLAPERVGATLKNDGTYTTTPFIGTSASAPHVSGLAGLLIQKNPKLSSSEVQAIIQFSSEDQINTIDDNSGRDEKYGYGRINARDALILAGMERTELISNLNSKATLIDEDGNIILSEDIEENASITELTVDENTQWHLVNSSNEVVALINTSGTLFLDSEFSEKESNLNNVSDPLYRIKKGSQALAVFDENGNLKLSGRAFLGVDPDRSSSQGN